MRRGPHEPGHASDRPGVHRERRGDVGGWCWVGPRSLRFFLRVNRGFVGIWLFVICGIALGFWVDVSDVPSWSVPPLTIATGTGATVAFMFCFSRAWVRDGD
jgi:hypothetical protein